MKLKNISYKDTQKVENCGYSSMVELKPSKLMTGVRFPLPAPPDSPMLGKTHRAETKLLQSQSHTGEKNSQYGTCWVTDGVKPIKIKKDSLDEYLAKGFQ